MSYKSCKKIAGPREIMSRGRNRLGFSLVEALVAVVLAGVGVAAAVGALGALVKSQARANEKERMTRFAVEKFEELAAMGSLTNVGGTFENKGEDRYVWEAYVDTTGIENVSQLTVTVSLSESMVRQSSESVYGVVYEEPIETDGGTP